MYGKVKKSDYYTKCACCKRIFCNEHFDMSRYAYTASVKGRKIYFCGFNCMIRYEREHKPESAKSKNKQYAY